MSKQLLTKTLLLVGMILLGGGMTWAVPATVTYTFTAKNWTAKIGNTEANWTSGAEGNGFSNNGIQVTTGKSGANGTSPESFTNISKVVVTYNTNKSAGVGSIEAQVGSNETKKNDVGYSGSANGTSAKFTTTFEFDPAESGNLKLTVNTTTNSIYLVSVEITYDEASDATLAGIKLSGDYQTTFHKGDAFNHDGMVVTATYDDETSKDVTPNATFSGYDMNTLGEQTVTVSYKDGEVTKTVDYTIVVIPVPVTPIKPEVKFVLVTDASILQDGDRIVLVAKRTDDYVIMTTQNSNNRAKEIVTVENDEITELPTGTQIITLEGTTGAWYFNVDNGYLYAASSDSNHLRTEETADDNAKATIEIAETGEATIKFQGSNKRNWLRYNTSAGIFSCYSDGMVDVYIYKEDNVSTLDVTIGNAGWCTLITTVDYTLPDGLKAYAVSAVADGKAELAELTEVKAGEPVLLEGAEGSYTLTLTEGAEAPETNLLQVSDETTTNGVYVLANKSNGVGFYRWNGGNLGAGRVYLTVPASTREFVKISAGETTGIDASLNEKGERRNERFFALQGRRVAQPEKGLYIVNGKKIVIK